MCTAGSVNLSLPKTYHSLLRLLSTLSSKFHQLSSPKYPRPPSQLWSFWLAPCHRGRATTGLRGTRRSRTKGLNDEREAILKAAGALSTVRKKGGRVVSSIQDVEEDDEVEE